MTKPQYTSTRKYLWWSFWLSWLVIFILVIGGLLGSEKTADLADIALPAMVAIIVCNLGVHRGFGSIDFWANAKRPQNYKRNNQRNNQRNYQQENDDGFGKDFLNEGNE